MALSHWAEEAVFYHVYPLGLCRAPERNDLTGPPVPRLEKLYGWLDHLQWLGVSALYLGPLFESGSHGYDTADYYRVDRRLGDNATLARLAGELHRRGFRLILDGVFHHVGREFWAFRDVRQRLSGSAYCAWFAGLSFEGRSPAGDPFSYEGWEGHHELVRLNLRHPAVAEHLLQAVAAWVREFGIDGLRLDVAYLLDQGFLRELARFCRGLRPDFWLLGEVIHGDYRQWVAPGLLDSATNYECYKGLYSSHNDANYFEIAYSLNRQFGEAGLYRGLPLYTFADNHDVNRVASQLRDPEHLYPLYCLLCTMPGVPSIYYGSEWGIEGRKERGSDRALRPSLELERVSRESRHRDLAGAIARLAGVRRRCAALRHGDYHQLVVSPMQLAFLRRWQGEMALVAVNAAKQPVSLALTLPPGPGLPDGTLLVDLLNPPESFTVQASQVRLELPRCWARILARAPG
jgi:cyclomaltodextrinase